MQPLLTKQQHDASGNNLLSPLISGGEIPNFREGARLKN